MAFSPINFLFFAFFYHFISFIFRFISLYYFNSSNFCSVAYFTILLRFLFFYFSSFFSSFSFCNLLFGLFYLSFNPVIFVLRAIELSFPHRNTTLGKLIPLGNFYFFPSFYNGTVITAPPSQALCQFHKPSSLISFIFLKKFFTF